MQFLHPFFADLFCSKIKWFPERDRRKLRQLLLNGDIKRHSKKRSEVPGKFKKKIVMMIK